MKAKTTSSLGAFIRTRRDRLSPEQVGLAPGFRRRAKGLRREELAALCGISPTWLTWIEQGRTEAVSAETLERIAAALRLSRAERSYLFELAGMRDPERPRVSCDPQLDAILKEAVAKIRTPAYVLDQEWNAVAWNPQAAQLFAEWLGKPKADRNLLRYAFLNPQARSFIVDWPSRAQRLVAEFRGECRAVLDTPEIKREVEELRSRSKEFDLFWSTQNVLEREGGERNFHHPKQGRLSLRQLTLSLAMAPGMKLVILL
ncbi:helix-turn-helix transcriptional regulator [Silvibacterium dinghuense]|uniref:XRE family transcriptional regulator n=1 Tax=Silvibacterium dinghuense TaxID=1560006 RepID=A0A4Q1S9W9_9BACT|nr:helix-turn-helix transcriptional regulator [Silvibacterium dinghuense]RXS93850.1 XRE family transcriptional regulator [Silvibacterium dinghuense]GGH08216.1 transcriptional regulator [Silvibacterium dinghuense]